jgi:hypothetical protein
MDKAKIRDFLPFSPRKLISLWDMINFCAGEIVSALNWLKGWGDHACIQVIDVGRDSKATAEDKTTLLTGLAPIEKVCGKHELSVSLSLCVRFKKALESDEDFYWQVIQSEIDGIFQSIQNELNATKFTFIQNSKAIFFEQEKLFGDAVYDAFPEARSEIKDAGNCLAADLNTAAVFHLMRVMELGLRALAFHLKAKTLIKKLKRTRIPIELGTWEEIISTLESKLDELRHITRSVKRDQKIETCNELLKEFRSVKDLWRNKVSHTRATYDAEQAQSAFNHVRGFIQKLEKFKIAPR